MGQGVKYGWPIYNVFDEVIDLYYVYHVYEVDSNGERVAIAHEKFFDGKIEAGYYYIETYLIRDWEVSGKIGKVGISARCF